MSFNSFQNTLEQLNNAKNLRAEQEFNDTMADINEKAQEKTNLFGDIEKAGASLGGLVLGMKSVKGIYNKIQKIRKGKSTTEETEETGDDLPEGLSREDYEGVISDFQDGVTQPSQATEEETEVPEPQVIETELAPTTTDVPSTELGTSQQTTEPFGRGEGDIEMRTMGSDNQPSEEGADPSFTGEGEGLTDAIDDVTPDLTSGLTDAVSGATDAISGLASAGATAGAEGLSEGLETAGAVAEAIPGIGSIVGLVLEGAGVLAGIGGVATGIIGSDVASTAQEKATLQAQKAEQQAQALPADVAGRYAVSAQSALQQFN